MNPLDDMLREFEKEIQEYIAQTWDVNDEVTETGSIITRARMKGHPMEVINGETGVFQLNMN
jgi:hypothetical protein